MSSVSGPDPAIDQLKFAFEPPVPLKRASARRSRPGDVDSEPVALPLPDAPALETPTEEPAPQLFVFVPDIDVHLHDPDHAVATIAGPEPERTIHWLNKFCSQVEVLASRRVLFPTGDLDRFMCIIPPHKVTLDAASLAVSRALWARALGFKPLRVDRKGRRIIASSVRWPTGWRVQDAPWTAVATLDRLGVSLDVEPRARALLTRKLAESGTHIAQAGLRGSAVALVSSRPDLLEALELPALAYDGAPGTGRYRMPLLAAGQLIEEPAVACTPELTAAIRHATRRTRPVIPTPGFPWTLYPFQAKDLGTALHIIEHTGGVLLAGDMGSGKATSVDTPVLTPHGRTTMGELRVGDQVLGRDGAAHLVRGVYPQGVRPVYRVTFTDRTSALVDDEHLWEVSCSPHHDSTEPGQVRSTRELRTGRLHDSEGNALHYIPMLTAPLQMDCSHARPVPPYTLGALLGVGPLTANSATRADRGTLSAEVRAELAGSPFEGDIVNQSETQSYSFIDRVSLSQQVRAALNDVGLSDPKTCESFVPDAYKFGPADVRLAVLQGLLDACASADGDNIDVWSPSEQLAADVQWLVESLGGTARIDSRRAVPPACNATSPLGSVSWRASIRMPGWAPPFRTAAKRVRYAPSGDVPARGVMSIEPDGTAEVVCIRVASPDSLFVIDHAIVTHNTTVALALAHQLDTWPLFVVAPLAAFSTWERQLAELGRSGYLCVEPIPVARQRLANEHFDAVVMSYDRIHRFLPEIEQAHFAALVADEIQRIRTPGSRRSRALRALAATVPIRIGLSGTPITNKPEDILPIGAFLVPGEWKPRLSMRDLAEVYPAEDPVEQLAEHLGTMMVRRKMEDTGAKLPGRHVRRVEVPLSPDQRRALRDMEEEAKAAKEAGELNHIHVFARLQKMRQIINIPSAAGVAGPNAKVAAAVGLAAEYADVGRKSVIFVADRPAWTEAGRRCEEAGIGWTGIWGSTSVADRIGNEKKFHNDPDIDVFIGTLASCAESLTLSPTATVTIFASLSYSPSAIAQAAARAYRMNQTNDVDEIYLHASAPGGTLDDRMHEILEEKRELFARVVDRTEYKRMNGKVSLGDLLYMLTGVRDAVVDDRQGQLDLEATETERRKKHARATLYKHKTGEGLDSGEHAVTHDEWLARERELLEADADDAGGWEELLDEVDNEQFDTGDD
jgi:hypothetical protein